MINNYWEQFVIEKSSNVVEKLKKKKKKKTKNQLIKNLKIDIKL